MDQDQDINQNSSRGEVDAPSEDKKTYFGMKVIFKKSVGLTPVKLESKTGKPLEN